MSIRILCVCKGNTCRSPMFAAVLRRRLASIEPDAIVESAGYHEPAKGQPANEEWDRLVDLTQIELGGHVSRWIGDLDLSAFDMIICMEQQAFYEVLEMIETNNCHVILANAENGGIPNPYQLGTDAYCGCYETILEVVADKDNHFGLGA